MKKIALLLFVCTLFCVGCQDSPEDKLRGVWMYEGLASEEDIYDYVFQETLIYHFKKKGDFFARNYSSLDGDLNSNWELLSDSILKIDSIQYTVKKLTKDTLQLVEDSDYNRTEWITFLKAKRTDINKSKEEVENILLSNIWSIEDSSKIYWETHFEYFDNKTMIYRYKINDHEGLPSPMDSLDNLQLETWGVDYYENHFFLYHYHNMLLSNGNFNRLHQITDIRDNSYSISDSRSKNNISRFVSKESVDLKHSNTEKIVGNWISQNSKDQFYESYLSKSDIDEGYLQLHEGPFHLHITKSIVNFRLDTITPFDWNWQLSKDGRILVLEAQWDEPPHVGTHVEYADIIEFTENKMKLRLFYNRFYTGARNSNKIIVNQVQDFKKQD